MINFFLKFKSSKGFTLVEILVVAGLVAFVTVISIRNLTGSRLNLDRLANVMASDFRLAQQLALSSHQHQGPLDPVPRNRCGYGITKPQSGGAESSATECSDGLDNDSDTFVDSLDPGCNRLYYIYAGPSTLDPAGLPVNCGSSNYQTNQDTPYYQAVVLDQRIDFVDNPAPKDIFYKPPGPTTYINNINTPSDLLDPTTYYQRMTIKKVGLTKTDCNDGSPNCRFICVYFSGRVEVSKVPTCPAPY